jgi:multidrug efflux system membrane fusion protein
MNAFKNAGRTPCHDRLPRTRALAGLRSAGLIPALTLALLPFILPACARDAASQRSGPRSEAAPVMAAQAQREDVPITLETIGTVEAYRTVAVRPRVGGTLESVHFREGQDVGAGQTLFSIDSRPYELALNQAQADLAQEHAKARLAAVNAGRAARLAEKDLVSAQEHDQLAAEAEAESAAVQAASAAVDNARLNLEFCSIKAPISGRSSNLLVQEGNLVAPNDSKALVVINQISPIFVSFSVPQKYLPDIMRYMAQGELPAEAVVAGTSQEPAHGRVSFVNNAVDPATGTVLLKAEFPNEDRKLWPGEFVQVSVVLTTRQGVVVVPAAAVQSGQKGDYVLVIKKDQTTEMRPVTTGARTEEKAIIESGLEPGESVVTDGHLRVVPGGKVTIKPDLESGANPPGNGRSGPAGGNTRSEGSAGSNGREAVGR